MSHLTMAQIDEQIKNAPLSKEDAKKHFIEKTEEWGLQHTFHFDEAWDYAVYQRKQKEFREKITEFEQAVNAHPAKLQAVHEINPTKHSFADGQYIREIFNPAGLFIVTKIHNKTHPFFLMQGEISMFSQDGVEKISAPYPGITQAGTKRAIYTHTECVFVTVHATDKLNIEDIEEEVIAKSFDDVKLLPPNIEQVENLISQLQEKVI